MNARFTPNTDNSQEDIIGDVIMGRDMNNFISSRLNQQKGRENDQYQQNVPVAPIGYPSGVVNNIPGNNYSIHPDFNQQPATSNIEEVQTKVIKIRFEIDFQINLQVNNK